MRKKPELLVSAGSLDELIRMADAGADAINIGSNYFGVRMPGDFNLEEIETAVSYAHKQDVKIYISVNNILENDQLKELTPYLVRLNELQVDAVVFGDPAVIMAMRQSGIQIPLHWNTEMTSTNYATANYWGSKGAARVVLARELNLEEIHEVKRNTKMEVQIQVHGITNIYHSKRNLVQSYMKHLDQNKEAQMIGKDQGLFLVEHERRELKLPIYEDENGTHIMSADDICMIENIDEILQEDIDSFKVEGLLKSIQYNETVVRCYRQAIDTFCKNPDSYKFNPDWLSEIQQLQDRHRELSYGFFFKEQVY